MSDNGKKKPAAFRTRPGDEGDYEVGYGKPPKETRFKKGRSGNPRGRPKGARTKTPDHDRLANIFLEEAYREVPLREGEREMRVPMVVAVVRALLVKGARGTARSAQVALELLQAIEDRKRHDHGEFLDAVITYKTEWEAEIADRKRRGEPEPELDIHPDQIVLDVATGDVHVTGPLTKEDRRRLKDFQEQRAELDAEVAMLRGELKRAESTESAMSIREEIAYCERRLDIIRSVLPE